MVKFLVWKIISYQRKVYQFVLIGSQLKILLYFVYETGLWACLFFFKCMILTNKCLITLKNLRGSSRGKGKRTAGLLQGSGLSRTELYNLIDNWINIKMDHAQPLII